ncbi:gelsolin, cytoplasmic isoform X2 [Palaemon carinicauda]|uniref:gelsolin, cytoplasmic isoform X2 n=1 Tax=Palaemon carinicauda TaxID=392227 RepID=UPI0035B5B7D6
MKAGKSPTISTSWLGSESSQDEAGAAAIKTVELDEQLGGVPVQHREVENHESSLFLSRFKSGIRYLKGGVASGFHHVDPDEAYPARLFHVKGRRNVRVRQVEASVGAMNKGDCFILDCRDKVYVYMGPSSRRMERLKAIHAGNAVRDDDHAGKSKVVIIDETASGNEVGEFFENLGGGSPDDIAEEDSAMDDSEFERHETKVVTLHHIFEDSSGAMQTKMIGEKPLLQSMLDSGDCFLLDTGNSVYVWIGRGSSKNEKIKSMEMGSSYVEQKGYPKWMGVQRVVEGAEPAVFKSYFKTWKEPEEQVGLGRVFTQRQISTVTAAEVDFDVSALHAEKRRLLQKNAGPAFGFMPDDGTGKIEIWRVEDFELQPVDESTHGFFFGGDSYVMKYTYEKEGRERYIIYFWQGIASSQDERAASAIHAVRLDNELFGKAVQVRVVQGYEPAHFLRIFKGRMVVFLGGKASGFKNVHDHDTYDVDGTRLFRVRGTCDLDTRAIQQPEEASSLNSDDAFVLETPSATYLWVGKGASEDEKSMGEKVASLVSPERDVQVIAEGEEDDGFWSGLGGKGDYQTARDLDRPLLYPRLFHCTISPAGCLRVHEVSNFSQEDLNEDDVMVLDSGDEVYIWVGQGSDDQEKEKAFTMAENYIRTDPTERTLSSTVLVRVNQGEEPAAFTSIFPAWNPDLWQHRPTVPKTISKPQASEGKGHSDKTPSQPVKVKTASESEGAQGKQSVSNEGSQKPEVPPPTVPLVSPLKAEEVPSLKPVEVPSPKTENVANPPAKPVEAPEAPLPENSQKEAGSKSDSSKCCVCQ